MALKTMEAWMADYMKSFYNSNPEIQKGILMKEEHTWYVERYSRELALHLGLSEHDVELATMIGLFHDIGRFRQFTLYQTFVDAVSEDHAGLSVKVLKEQPFMNELEPEDLDLVYFAIMNHNKKVIEKTDDKRKLLFARLIRDADKLDIYRVLEPFLGPSDGMGFAPDFLEKFARGQQVDYNKIRTNDDRKLVRLMWVYDVNFAWTLKRIVDRGYVDKIIANLPDNPDMKKGVARLRSYIESKCMEKDVSGIESKN